VAIHYSAGVRRTPVFPTIPACGRVSVSLSKILNLVPPLCNNLPLSGCQETCFPKAHRGPVLSTTPAWGRVPILPLSSENTRLSTEEMKTVTCYSVGGARRPATPRFAETQHFPSCLPAEESHLPCLRARISAPPVSGIMLLCRHMEVCISQCTEAQHSPVFPAVGESLFPHQRTRTQFLHCVVTAILGDRTASLKNTEVQGPHHFCPWESPSSPIKE
jgi:hypothetical protein